MYNKEKKRKEYHIYEIPSITPNINQLSFLYINMFLPPVGHSQEHVRREY